MSDWVEEVYVFMVSWGKKESFRKLPLLGLNAARSVEYRTLHSDLFVVSEYGQVYCYDLSEISGAILKYVDLYIDVRFDLKITA
jgi:hypothetical protein